MPRHNRAALGLKFAAGVRLLAMPAVCYVPVRSTFGSIGSLDVLLCRLCEGNPTSVRGGTKRGPCGTFPTFSAQTKPVDSIVQFAGSFPMYLPLVEIRGSS